MMARRYYAASSEDEERAYAHSFFASNYQDALRVCAKNGWKYDGEIIETVEVVAMSDEQVLLH